jgi:DNA (cytosine-5)-methyltransferase 1
MGASATPSGHSSETGPVVSALSGECPSRRPRLLDLYCGAGGAAMGYFRAGFDVVGVDINPQPHYPFTFIQADCTDMDSLFGIYDIDAIHASPPCQAYTRKSANWGRKRVNHIEHPDLLGPTRDMLEAIGLPYVIENVIGAPMRSDLVLCGTMFGLRIIKHRQFETNFPVVAPDAACDHSDVYNPWQGKGRSAREHREAQGTPWIPQCGGASRKAGVTGDLNNAIPPAFTKFIGDQLYAHLASLKQEAA